MFPNSIRTTCSQMANPSSARLSTQALTREPLIPSFPERRGCLQTCQGCERGGLRLVGHGRGAARSPHTSCTPLCSSDPAFRIASPAGAWHVLTWCVPVSPCSSPDVVRARSCCPPPRNTYSSNPKSGISSHATKICNLYSSSQGAWGKTPGEGEVFLLNLVETPFRAGSRRFIAAPHLPLRPRRGPCL